MGSTSWRLTRPLRMAGSLLRHIRGGTLRELGRRLLRRLVLRVTASERMRRLLIPMLLRVPGAAERISTMLNAIKQSDAAPGSPAALQLPAELKALPASARRVLADLERARRNSTGS
jgi:hypothetical protein